jgi:hypothetical protein
MLRAMIVLMVPVILIVGLFRLLGHDTPPTIDTAPAYGAAQADHRFDVLTPVGLAKGWHISAASYESGLLRVGITSPNAGALQFVESSSPPETLVPAEVGAGARPQGNMDVNGTTWQRYAGGRAGERAIVLATRGRTVIIVGEASDTDVRTLAAALRPPSP